MKGRGPLPLLAASMFIIVIDTTIMNVSISALVEDLNTTVTGIQAAICLYALVMASLILIGGKLADLYGRRRVFLLGLIVFGLGTSIASFSHSLTVLIVGWSLLEGIGSALMLPNIQTILRSEYEGAARASAYGVVSAVAAIGAAFGPIVGGLLTTYASWRWAFRLEVVIVIAVLLLRARIRTDVLPAKRPRFDLAGAVLSIFGWSSIVMGILLIQDYGLWQAKQPLVIGSWSIAPLGLSVAPFLFGLGVVLVAGLFALERRRERQGADGLFRPSLFGTPGLTPAVGVRGLHMATMAGFLFLLPLVLQLTFAYSAVQTGLALMPYSVGVLVFAVLGARLSSRFAARRIIQVGLALGLLGLAALTATIRPGITAEQLASGFVFGLGMGLVASQILNLILSSGQEGDTPEVAGLNGTFEQLGNSIGVALVGTIMLGVLTSSLTQRVETSPVIPEAAKPQVIETVDRSVELVSDAQVAAALEASGLGPTGQVAVQEVYSASRATAFRSGMGLLLLLAAIGLLFTPRLSGRRLVEPSPD